MDSSEHVPVAVEQDSRNSSGFSLALPVQFQPKLITQAGEAASRRYLEFFAAQIRNKNTREAYMRACSRFLDWCDQVHIPHLEDIEPVHVAAHIELLGDEVSAPTVKQHLAAVRMLFDWLVVGHIVRYNPAAAVRGPKHVVKTGKTPVLTGKEAAELLDSIDTDTLVGLRDRALISCMVYSFARVSAVTGMQVKDYFPKGKRYWFRLHEKGGKYHEVPCHHLAEEWMDRYLFVAEIKEETGTPLFRSTRGRSGTLTDRGMCRQDVFSMIRRRAKKAGIDAALCCHTFRATGITVFLERGGELETAATIAAHESTRTTQLYDRRGDDIKLEEVERIRLS
ncbi:MAG: tyrosine-type recombinase/integrase [Verrucomicrobiae bacterium]|nr:tyrosine-type recombinase/integrase [Verrucomicrobiae bacterium]